MKMFYSKICFNQWKIPNKYKKIGNIRFNT